MKRNKAIALLLSVILAMSLMGCVNKETYETGKKPEITDVTDILKDGDKVEESDGDTSSNESDTEIDSNQASEEDDSEQPVNEEVNLGELTGTTETELDASELLSTIYEFRVIDCGQADSILLHSRNSNVLIDAGEEKSATAIKKVLDNLGVKKIDILIATHPHQDHIGGMQEIVENYEIEKIIMSPSGHTSKTYEELLLAIEDKGLKIVKAESGAKYSLSGLELKIIGPNDDYSDLNDDSVVVLASYGDTDMLLTGDAGYQAEKDYVDYLGPIEILKVGHHGSDTSTSENLLNITEPDVAVISCGTDNQYGHPTAETMDKLRDRNIETYQTNINGDVLIRTDGVEYTIECKKNETPVITKRTETDTEQTGETGEPGETGTTNGETSETVVPSEDIVVYVAKEGKYYHYTSGCPRLYTSREVFEVTEKEALSSGTSKCSRCW